MASEATTTLPGFGGGLNIRDAANKLSADECRILENMLLDEHGGAGKRAGSTAQGTFGSGADRALSMYTFYRVGSTPQFILHTTAGKLYYSTDRGATWTQIATGLSASAPFSYETFGGKCYMSNGVDDYRSWDGASQTTFPAAPHGKFIRLWKDTMWMSGITGLADRTYSSLPGDPESWPIAGWVDIGKGNGDASTCLASDGNYLIFFKLRGHYIIYDPVTFANRLVDYEKGCESHFSAIPFDGQVYFLSRRGVCVFIGDAPAELISSNLDPLFDPAVLNLDALDTSWAYAIDNRVGWALPEIGGNVPTFQIELYPRLPKKPWSIMRMPGACFVKVRQTTLEELFFVGNATNKTYQAFAAVGTDDGATFKGVIETGWFDLGSPALTKYLRRITLVGRGQFIMGIKTNFANAINKSFVVDLSTSVDTWSVLDKWNVWYLGA
jgi:hypothetical protein